jgi:molybdate transport system regulatory protein
VAKKNKYTVSFRIWFYSGDNKFLGIGRVELLERIKATGSIANAAKEMKMSYRQAWQMVAEMNERSSSPLVEKQLGGKSGGGAVVTQSGIQAIETFHTLENKVRIFIQNETKKLKL